MRLVALFGHLHAGLIECLETACRPALLFPNDIGQHVQSLRVGKQTFDTCFSRLRHKVLSIVYSRVSVQDMFNI